MLRFIWTKKRSSEWVKASADMELDNPQSQLLRGRSYFIYFILIFIYVWRRAESHSSETFIYRKQLNTW